MLDVVINAESSVVKATMRTHCHLEKNSVYRKRLVSDLIPTRAGGVDSV